MDAAAKTVESLSQHILPDKPHHLSYNPHWRYCPRPDDAAHGSRSGTRFEEWHNTRLQYMTLVSHADRGTLLTRSYYDMREEPPKPVPREVSALAKAGGDKKLSLSDYKNKKTGAASSAFPPELAVAKRKDGHRSLAGPAAPASDPVAASSRPTNPDAKPPTSDFRKPDAYKLSDSQPSSSDAKQLPPRESAIDMRLPPKPPSLPLKPPSPSAKKRVADTENKSRPQKHPRPDNRRLADRPPPPRDDALRRKERPQPAAREAPLHKEDRSTSSSSLPNGRAIFKGTLHPTRNPSPGARPRADAVNGVRQHSSGGNIGTPAKPDVSKSSVPPLLSPLNLSFNGDIKSHPDDGDSNARKEKKRRDESGDTKSTIKAVKKPEPSFGSKKNKVPLVITPLLSPTLPPAVEAELRRRKKASPESADEKLKDGKDASGVKRPAAGANDEEPNRLGHRRRLIVVLSIPKGLQLSVRKILALPTDRRDAHLQDRERGRERDKEQDRSGSVEASQATQARKRPAGPADILVESAATKRPRTSDVARVAATPSTPSKRSTAMSRVSSSNSMAQTPGETINATPMAAPSADRRPNGYDPSTHRPDRPEIKSLADVEYRLKRKAISLKHDSDQIMRNHRASPNGASSRGNLGESQLKLKYALSVESILAFVMSFHAQSTWRGLSNRKNDYQSWDSVLPLIEYTHTEMRGHGLNNSQPLYALVLLLHAIVLDELIKCYASLDVPPPTMTLESLLKLERRKARLWPIIRDLNAHIDSSTLRVEASPWFSIDDVTGSGLRILRNWCSEESVDWTPEPILRESWPINPRHL